MIIERLDVVGFGTKLVFLDFLDSSVFCSSRMTQGIFLLMLTYIRDLLKHKRNEVDTCIIR